MSYAIQESGTGEISFIEKGPLCQDLEDKQNLEIKGSGYTDYVLDHAKDQKIPEAWKRSY